MDVLKIRQSKGCRFLLLSELSNRYSDFKIILLQNKWVAIVSNRGSLPDKINTVVLYEEKDKPLYKQHMDLMMGKKISKEANLLHLRCNVVDNPKQDRYKIYEVI